MIFLNECDNILWQSKRSCKVEYALLAQLDRVFGYEPKGQGFESLAARHGKEVISKKLLLFYFFCVIEDSKDERHRATVRWTVVTASDQATAVARIESLAARQNPIEVRASVGFFLCFHPQ